MGIFDKIRRDLRYGARMLMKRPGFSFVAILSLAIGIGANTAIFSAVNALLLKELPYENPDELVDIHLQLPDFRFSSLSYPDFDDVRANTADVFSGVVGSQFALVSIDEVSDEQDVFGEAVTGNYFSVLGVDAALGRTIGPDDDRVPGGHPVVMLSYDFWQNAFGGDVDIVGRTLRLEDRAYTVIGVASADYPGILRGVIRPSFYVPMMMIGQLSPGDLLNARDNHNLAGKARLAPGVSLAQAEAAVASVASELSEERPNGWDPAGTFELVETSKVLLSPEVDTRIRSISWVLMGVVASILLVVCVNLTGFLLARAMERRPEVALRMAIGATRGTLIRQLLVEATLLGLLGGAFGYLLAVWLLNAAARVDIGIGFALNPDISPDLTVALFTLGVSLTAGAFLALIPALQSTKPDVASTIKSNSAGSGQPARTRWRDGLVVMQLTVSLVILISAGLFLKSFQEQSKIDAGFGQSPAGAVSLALPTERYSVEEGRIVFDSLVERFRSLPGVGDVGRINGLPMSQGVQWIDFGVDGHQPAEGRETFQADYAVADGEFFAAAGVPIIQGRAFDEADTVDGERAAIVSREFARRFWAGEDAIGRTIRMVGGSPALPGGAADLRVVGVADDIAWESLNESPRMLVYVSQTQFYMPFVTFVAGTSIDAESTALAMRSVILDVDPNISIFTTTTLEQHLAAQLGPARILASLLAAFAAIVLILAVIGLHGVVSFAVSTRTREVGIRMALGADKSRISRLVAASGARLVFAGAALGLLLSLPINRLLSGVLVGVESLDATTFIGATLVLSIAAMLAAYLPARRASQMNPVSALRA